MSSQRKMQEQEIERSRALEAKLQNELEQHLALEETLRKEHEIHQSLEDQMRMINGIQEPKGGWEKSMTASPPDNANMLGLPEDGRSRQDSWLRNHGHR